ncbi:Vesicle transport V-snare protein [Coemansia sp. RSA 353]|nr:Vesicle transport V-snare protein [Coemansia sp. RSA 678]KAJ2157308.1 Vesicle transport V-snare protein [Coemansia sp. RSA 560]KAJ2204869.1 t-SNARE VTI1 [Coemansia sp. RSA 520]KAJ2263043.1 Vesicle transport V-snare protein [Coemansia sp. RSA 371]KAJ2266132.1 Vesicle transport V-snare protein [Coemansia sp. RSA 370]KAJ2282575.1 Vesicle transport V-snare protein [Coemansia sp. RSA 355]KAJ2285605.1 Vesicle transport V-snare protein [Coemansia sp. RSA 353]KAJ2420914.1 t-SNARE VTI1 [Coemansia 
MSLDLFNNYESEYTKLVSSARHRLDSLVPELAGAARTTALRETERELEDAHELAGQMEMELLALAGPERARAAPRMRQYKADIEHLKREARKAAQGLGSYESNRRALLGADYAESDGGLDGDNRTRLLSGNERLTRGSQRLQESHRIAVETEAVGANILNDLRGQREQIVNTRDALLHGESHIDRSQRTLRTMTRRLMTNKMITTGLIVVGVSLVLLILYIKLTR